jgi:Rieske Fe-S protein
MSGTTRRTLLAGATGTGAVIALAACGDNGTTTGSTDTGTAETTSGASTAPASSAPAGDAAALAKTTDIPVNGGKVFEQQGVVVTQPAAGTYKAFTSTCTHMGCTVGPVQNNVINCHCHRSEFSAADGSVKKGPATKPLTAKTVTVKGSSITVA